MFGGAPPQFSAAELKAMEAEANSTVRRFITAATVLYLSPFAIDFVRNLL